MASLIFLLEDNVRRGLARERVFRDRTRPLDYLNDTELLQRYRFRRNDIIFIVGLIEDNIQPETKRSHSISAEAKVLCSLRFLAKGSFYSETGDLHGISKSSVCRHLHTVCRELKDKASQFISFPEDLIDQRKIKEGFYNMNVRDEHRFPNVLGAIDGTLIPIRRPVLDEEIYMSRKNFHAINCQAICDSKLLFLNFVAKWPGATHDAFMWSNCALFQRFDSGSMGDGWLLGDSAYGLRRYMMVPFRNPQSQAQIRYNAAQSKARNSIERSFGVLKQRFRCLHRSGGCLQFEPAKCCNIILAAAVLHNIAILRKAPAPQDCTVESLMDSEQETEENSLQENRQRQPGGYNEGLETRRNLVADRF